MLLTILFVVVFILQIIEIISFYKCDKYIEELEFENYLMNEMLDTLIHNIIEKENKNERKVTNNTRKTKSTKKTSK